jgi:hypothetical protein
MLRTAIGAGGSIEVDREAGVIKGVSVITIGTTKVSGNGVEPFDVDATTLEQVAAALNGAPIGVKSRITHPEILGEDDLPYRKGYMRNARIDGDVVRADMYFHNPADPDAIKLMDIAENDPTSCGLSIIDDTAAIEPDPSTPTGHVLRIDKLDAVDWVGTPAANPRGMLSAQRRIVRLSTESQTMNQKQRDFLSAAGLPYDATDQQIADFIAALDETQRAQFNALKDPPVVENAVAQVEGEAAPAAPETPAEEQPVAEAEGDLEDEEKPQGVAASAVSKQVKLALQAERARTAEIRRIALKCGYDQAWVDKQINADTPIDRVRQIALDGIQRDPKNMPTSRVSVGRDLNRDTLDQAVQDAVLLHGSRGTHRFVEFDEAGGIMLGADRRPRVRQPHARAQELRSHSLLDIGRRYLVALGYHQADRMARPQLASLLLNRNALNSALSGVYLAHATGDFPYLLADAMGKILRAEYALAPATWPLWCNRTTAPDFKQIKKLQLSEAADLVLVPEGDEYQFGTLSESREVYALSSYGKGLNFTRQAMINDDLDAFARVPRMLGQAAARKVEGLAVAVLTANAQMADSVALFATAHANLVTGTLSVSSLGGARAAMRKQTALGSSDPLDLMPKYLIVPEILFTTASQLVSSAVDPALNNATPNPFANQLQVISSPRLDTTSTTQWYLAADPGQVDTVDVCFLEGQEAPLVEEENEFSTGALQLKVTQDAVAKAIDWRGLVRSSGS